MLFRKEKNACQLFVDSVSVLVHTLSAHSSPAPSSLVLPSPPAYASRPFLLISDNRSNAGYSLIVKHTPPPRPRLRLSPLPSENFSCATFDVLRSTTPTRPCPTGLSSATSFGPNR